MLNKASVDLKELDKNTGVLPIYGTVLDYVKEVNGAEIKGYYPMQQVFEYHFDLSKQSGEQINSIYNKLFKVKKDVTQINFIGELIENGTVTITYDELPDEIKELVDIGAYPLEEALTKCTQNRTKDKKMVILRPEIGKSSDDDNVVSKLMRFESAYTEDELIFDIPSNEEDSVDETTTTSNDATNGDELDWLKNL